MSILRAPYPGGESVRQVAELSRVASVLVLLAVWTSSSAAFDELRHNDIARTALGFLRGGVLQHIQRQYYWMDAKAPSIRGAEDEKHFDDCEFNGAAEFIRNQYKSVRANLDQKNLWEATEKFGRLLHTVEDFYSHSNWVELFPRSTYGQPATLSDLVDLSGAPSLARPWFAPEGGEVVRDDILLGADDWGPLAAGSTIDRSGGGRLVPTLIDPQGRVRGRLLETGEGTFDDECDVFSLDPGPFGPLRIYTGIDHETLNKDGPPDGAKYPRRLEQHLRAKALAILQVKYEWCRLVRQAGQAGADGLLLALWVKPGGSPHPTGTPCATQSGGSVGVVLTIDDVRIRRSGDDAGTAGEIQFAVALYDDATNFHRSVHATNRGGSMSLREGDHVPRSQLPRPVVLCVRPGQRTSIAVHAWDNDDSSRSPYAQDLDYYGEPIKFHGVEGYPTDPDEILVGFQRRLIVPLPVGPQQAISDDLEIKYHLSRKTCP